MYNTLFKIISVINIRSDHPRSSSDLSVSTHSSGSSGNVTSVNSKGSSVRFPVLNSNVPSFFSHDFAVAPSPSDRLISKLGKFFDLTLENTAQIPEDLLKAERLISECREETVSKDSFLFALGLVFGEKSKLVGALVKSLKNWEKGKSQTEISKKCFDLLSMLVEIVTKMAPKDGHEYLLIPSRELKVIFRALEMGVSKIDAYQADSMIPDDVKKSISMTKIAEFTAAILKHPSQEVFVGADSVLERYNAVVHNIKVSLLENKINVLVGNADSNFREHSEDLSSKAMNFHERKFILFPWCLELIKSTRHPLLTATYDADAEMPTVLEKLYKVMTHLVFWIVGIDDIADNVQSRDLMNLFMLVPLLTNKEGHVDSEHFDTNVLHVENDKTMPPLLSSDEFGRYLAKAGLKEPAGQITIDVIRGWVSEEYPEFLEFFNLYVDAWFQSLDEYKQVIRDVELDLEGFRTNAQQRLRDKHFQIDEFGDSPLTSENSFKERSWNDFYHSLLRVLRSMVVSVDINSDYTKWLGPDATNVIEKGLSENMLMTLYKVFEEQVLDVIGVSRGQELRSGFAKMFEDGENVGHRGNNIATLKRELTEVDLSNPIIFLLAGEFNRYIENVYEGRFSEFLSEEFSQTNGFVAMCSTLGICPSKDCFEAVIDQDMQDKLDAFRFFDVLKRLKSIDEEIFSLLVTRMSSSGFRDELNKEKSENFKLEFARQNSWSDMVDLSLTQESKDLLSEELQQDVKTLFTHRKSLEKLLDIIFENENVQRGYKDYYGRLKRTLKSIHDKRKNIDPNNAITSEIKTYHEGVSKLVGMYLVFKSDL